MKYKDKQRHKARVKELKVVKLNKKMQKQKDLIDWGINLKEKL